MTNVKPFTVISQIELPIIISPMFLVSSVKMVIEGCKAGVIGSFPLANARTLEDLDNWMIRITEGLSTARSNEPTSKIAPWAVNLAVHHTNARYEVELEYIRKYKPPVVITSLGDPSRVVGIVHDYGGLVFSDVVNLVHARKAAERGTDGLILVCNGAGGHAGTYNPFAFIHAVKEFWDGITILAGGISTGRDILAARILGADLVYMGTRFLASKESLANSEYQKILFESTIEDIIYTDVFSGVNANYLIPSLQRAGIDPKQLPTKESFNWSRANDNGPKVWKNIWSAGHGVGAIKKEETVAEIIDKLKHEYLDLSTNKNMQNL
ncbi:NAD(P)H-dependent flavin oxidoreductase [Sporolactobacillus putidus]|uniref:Probable nitronate monooxygenase n=1 Tax=Sporolactobacillus putidus TaxID=492735 RepID=A0A917S774_9BACL|nr:nitronate monooxygenase [Sporolactobacillus putidus]GGL60401.1 2-nitropropane dioxygenase [Sporolactobacillus putidus]